MTSSIGVGFLMGDAMDTVAKQYPNTQFAIIDVDAARSRASRRTCAASLFAEQEAGYLVGRRRLRRSRRPARQRRSVGGLKIPPVDHYIAGYQYCAKQADPSIKTLNGYSQDFVAQDKCKEIALNQIAQGSDVVFQVAGECGLGALDAAEDEGRLGHRRRHRPGVPRPAGADERAQEGRRRASTDTIKACQDGTFKGGVDGIFNTANGGVGYGKLSPKVPAAIRDAVNKQSTLLKAGKIKGIPTHLK